jgi:hypothetical protein
VCSSDLTKFIGGFFGISYANPHEEMKRVLNRKKNQTPFFNRVIDSIKNKNVKLDDLNK